MTSLFDQSSKKYEDFLIRPLELQDFNKGYLECLNLLTSVGECNFEMFKTSFETMRKNKMHYIFVAESNDKIIGTGTLGIEQKFIRNCALKGRVEDLITTTTTMEKRSDVDKAIMDAIVEKARQLGCYKMSLESLDKHLDFYQSYGLEVDAELEMAIRFKDSGDNTETRYKNWKNEQN